MSEQPPPLFLSPRVFNIDAVLQLMAAGGLLSRLLPGYDPRPQQLLMMRNILEAFNESHIGMIEAGTGTGKSLAYLVPALLWASHTGERVLISTNTITLQEQLLQKDIPNLSKALGIPIRSILVKGMGNYVCKRKLAETNEEQLFLSAAEKDELGSICAWERETYDGSRSTLPNAVSAQMWEKIAAEKDTCNLNDCPHFQNCHFFKARKNAQEAHIIIANHHLLFADLSIRGATDNYSGSAVLPFYGKIIVDEAHHIEDIATAYFSKELSWLELLRTLARIASEKSGQSLGKLPQLKQKIEDYWPKNQNKEVEKILNRINLDLFGFRKEILEASSNAFKAFSLFIPHSNELRMRLLPQHLETEKWKLEVIPRVEILIKITLKYSQSLMSLENDLQRLADDRFLDISKGIRFELAALSLRLQAAADHLKQFICSKLPLNKVFWIECQIFKTMTNVNTVEAELDVSSALVKYLFKPFSTVILCSATLATSRQFRFTRERLGLIDEHFPDRLITENSYESPFDYQTQALLIIPPDMPAPQEQDFLFTAMDTILKAIKVSQGAAFVLFTSYAMLQECHEKMSEAMTRLGFTLYKQGDEDRQSLLRKFKSTPRAVLFGTDSFWEGVDVAGDALRCVIIVKLPFKVPTEPIIQARTEAILARGGDPFFEYSLPSAIMKFKQGFGRLIRNKKDRGCIICLDSRLLTKRYGKQFLKNLPDCQVVNPPLNHLEAVMHNFYEKTNYLVAKA